MALSNEVKRAGGPAAARGGASLRTTILRVIFVAAVTMLTLHLAVHEGVASARQQLAHRRSAVRLSHTEDPSKAPSTIADTGPSATTGSLAPRRRRKDPPTDDGARDELDDDDAGEEAEEKAHVSIHRRHASAQRKKTGYIAKVKVPSLLGPSSNDDDATTGSPGDDVSKDVAEANTRRTKRDDEERGEPSLLAPTDAEEEATSDPLTTQARRKKRTPPPSPPPTEQVTEPADSVPERDNNAGMDLDSPDDETTDEPPRAAFKHSERISSRVASIRDIDRETWCAPAEGLPDRESSAAARALAHAFLKAWQQPDRGIDVGVLVSEGDVIVWFDSVAKWVAPLRRLVVVVNIDEPSTKVMPIRDLEDQVVKLIVAGLSSEEDGESASGGGTKKNLTATVRERFIVIYPGENLGVAAGWNTIVGKTLTATTPVAQGHDTQGTKRDWLLLLNADVAVECATLADFVYISDLLGKRSKKPRDDDTLPSGLLRARKHAIRRCPVTDTKKAKRSKALPVSDPVAPVALHHLSGFAAFAVYGRSVRAVGSFDENVWPAYGEDIEYALRLRSQGHFTRIFSTNRVASSSGDDDNDGVVLDPMTAVAADVDAVCTKQAASCGIDHVGSLAKRRDKRYATMLARWARGEYLFQKWGFDRHVHHRGTAPGFCPFARPFNVTTWKKGKKVPLTAWATTVIDPEHQSCVRGTADGPFFERIATPPRQDAADDPNRDPRPSSCSRLCRMMYDDVVNTADEGTLDAATQARLTSEACHAIPNF